MSRGANAPVYIPRAFTIVRTILSLVLFSAAGFKAYELWFQPLSTASLFSSPRTQVALIEFETALGLWLLTGLYPYRAWLAAITTFGLFALASLYLAVIGQPSCGCFGRLSINPWYTFGLDLVSVIVLWYWRPLLAARMTPIWAFQGQSLRLTLRRACIVVIVFTSCFGTFYLLDRLPAAALASLRGELVTVEPAVTDVGGAFRGEFRDFRIQLQNQTDQPIQITGGTADCSCVATRDLPITLLAGEATTIDVSVKFKGTTGTFQQHFVLLTDSESQRMVVARITGHVLNRPAP